MAEDPAKEESKENLKFFKNAKGQKPESEDQIEAEEVRENESRDGETAKPAPASAAESTEVQPAEADAELESKVKRPSVPLLPLLTPTLALAIRTLVILAIIVADASAAYFLVVKALAPRLTEARVVRELTPPPVPGVEPGTGEAGTLEGEVPAVGTITPIADIVINPSGTAGKRYLCATVALEAIEAPLVEEIKSREPQIRDLLIEILSRRTVDDLSSLQARENIRLEIEESVNDLLVNGDVVGVYFSNFVLQ
jgi:flagellar FliL protein